MFYRRAPDAPGVPTLYLHGIPTSSDDWVEFLARTGGIAPDLIGFGRSAKGGHLDYSLDGLTGFVEWFLAEMHLDVVKLVAHDWGAAIGLELAAAAPRAGRAARAVNAPPLIDGFPWPRLLRLWRAPLIGEGLMGSFTRGMLARELRRGSVREDAWPDARVAEVWEQFDQGTQRAILRLVRSAGPRGELPTTHAPSTHASTTHAPSTHAPALILWGERDPWYPPALADAYAARLPGAQVERLSDAGHWPWLDRDDFIERVATFLEE